MKSFAIAIGLGALIGCASNPDKIDAAYVSPLKYAEYTCSQLAQELDSVGRRTNDLYGRLKRDRTADNWQTAAGVVLFWPALFFLEGGDGPEASEYAQLQGDFEALRVNSVQKNCNLNYRSPEELFEAADDEGLEDPEKSSTGNIAERLAELDSLLEQGLISTQEYDSARARILGID